MNISINLSPSFQEGERSPQKEKEKEERTPALNRSSIPDSRFSPSCIGCWLSCPRKFKYKYVLGLRPVGKAIALTFGGAFHQALYRLYQGESVEEVLEEFDELPPARMCEDTRRSREHAVWLLKEYVNHYSPDPLVFVESEVEFLVSMPGDSYLIGRMDGIVIQYEQYYVLDHKTSSRISMVVDQVRPHLQFDCYCQVVRELLGSCGGVIVNAISTAKKPQTRFIRAPSIRTNEELDGLLEDWEMWVEDIRRAVKNKRFPRNRRNCSIYGSCPYSDLCLFGETPSALTRYEKEGK